MIKINDLNKFYNKNSSNSLHVINNVTLELPETGLVTFLGKSGCGKTTLLNVIGGNDSMDSGSIIYDSLEFKKYSPRVIDKYRQKNIGYIFQNYLLIEDMSVYDNLKEQLEIIGIFDKEEQKARIEYALKIVGLYKYRKKPANRLSGGEQQRVSIARSLVKKSKLIIADEPTGNLDSENSIEVMNILKQISKTTLVLLVTHNVELANCYSDRIIRLKDGCVESDSGNQNITNTIMTSKNEKDIHLLDYVKLDVVGNDCDINVYKDSSDVSINVRIILKNNTLYIDSPNKVVLTNDAKINILNDHYHEEKKIEISEEHFDNSFYDDTKKGKSKNFKLFLNAITSFFHTTKKQRAFRMVFFIIGCIIASCAVSFSKALTVDESKISNEEASIIAKDNFYYYGYMDPKDINKAINDGVIKEYYIDANLEVVCKYSLNSKRTKTYRVPLFNYPYSKAESYGLACGVKPTGNNVVIGKKIADEMLQKFEIDSYEKLIGCKFGQEYSNENSFIICGVSNKYTNSMYFDSRVNNYLNNMYLSYKANVYEASVVDGYTLIEGVKPKEGECLINESILSLGYKIGDKFANYIITGVFKTINPYIGYEIIVDNQVDIVRESINDDYGDIYIDYIHSEITTMGDATLLSGLFELKDGRLPESEKEIIIPFGIKKKRFEDLGYTVVGTYIQKDYTICFDAIGTSEAAIDHMLSSRGFGYNRISYDVKENISNYGEYKIYNLRDYIYEYELDNNKSTQIANLIPTVILLIVIMIYVYFTTKSRLLVNIRNVGILRSIGATKNQILKTYAINTIVETFFTSLLGYILIATVNIVVSVKFAILTNAVVNATTIIVLVLFGILVFIINLIFGLLPVISLMKKTPSEIISKYDI